MPIFNNVEIYFSILKYKWRKIRTENLPIAMKELIESLILINNKKKLNIKKYWLLKMIEFSEINI